MELVKAWPKNGNHWQIVVAGWDQAGYLSHVTAAATENGLRCVNISLDAYLQGEEVDADVVFLGPVFKEQKDALYRYADAFVLPSFSEGLPMSVLEAWSYSLPVLMTAHCNIPRGFEVGAAYRLQVIEGDSQALQQSLEGFWSMQLGDVLSMGQRGRALVEREFTWEIVANHFVAVYEDLIG